MLRAKKAKREKYNNTPNILLCVYLQVYRLNFPSNFQTTISKLQIILKYMKEVKHEIKKCLMIKYISTTFMIKGNSNVYNGYQEIN